MTRRENPAAGIPDRHHRSGLLSRRQALGVLLLFLLLMAGRIVRRQMLLDPQGQWRQELWLDGLLASAEPQRADPVAEKPVLTSPLPFNTCSAESLTLLPGIGPVLADRIDEVRRAGIVFRSASDLEQVKGIGPVLAARLQPWLDFQLPGGTAPPEADPEVEKQPSGNSR